MKARCFGGWRSWVVVVCSAVMPIGVVAQNPAPGAPRPPEIDRLMALAKDPERIRQLMSDPVQLSEVMRTMESPAVQEFMRDPQRVQELMREVDMVQIGQAMRAIDPTAVRKAMSLRVLERLRKQLDATEEEWAVLGPRIEKLLAAQQEVRAGIRGMGGRGGGGIGGGPGGGRFGAGSGEPTEVEEAAADVREATQDPDVDVRETKIRLSAYRKARDKARERLEESERDLRELLSVRQEGILVMLGLLN